MRLPTDTLYIILDIASTNAVIEKDFNTFLRLSRVNKAFKHIMYKKNIRRMFLTAHAIKAKKYRTWEEIGPRVNKFLSNPMFRFDDQVIIDICCSYNSTTFNLQHKKDMIKFFGHRGSCFDFFKTAHPHDVYTLKHKTRTGRYAIVATKAAIKLWKIGKKTLIMMSRPIVYQCRGSELQQEPTPEYLIFGIE
jgi:hypothetical protein